jgi:hypothetical protein
LSSAAPIADFVAGRLAIHLGPNVARLAVKTFAQKAVALKPEQLTLADVPRLIEAMRPMLHVMVGKEPGEVVLRDIAREYQLA